jgi:hypothetical protein
MNATRQDNLPPPASSDGSAQTGQTPTPAATERVHDGAAALSSAATESQPLSPAQPAADQALRADAAETTPNASALQQHTRRLERISHLIFEEVVLVRHLGVDSLAVVLKPDARTELFLRLTRQNGQIEAQVRVDRGDFTALNAQWPRLAESLAQHGVRVHPLLPAMDSPGDHPSSALAADTQTPRESAPRTTDHEPGQPPFHRRHPRRQWDSDLAAVGSPTEPVGRRPARGRHAARRGFDDWA